MLITFIRTALITLDIDDHHIAVLGKPFVAFPYRRFADLSVNSIHLSAPCLFRDMVIPMLESAELSGEPRQDADRLVRSLKQFVPVSPALLPEDSLLREFLGKTGLKNKD